MYAGESPSSFRDGRPTAGEPPLESQWRIGICGRNSRNWPATTKSLGYTFEDTPGNRITNAVTRWRSRLRVLQSETVLGLDWGAASIEIRWAHLRIARLWSSWPL